MATQRRREQRIMTLLDRAGIPLPARAILARWMRTYRYDSVTRGELARLLQAMVKRKILTSERKFDPTLGTRTLYRQRWTK